MNLQIATETAVQTGQGVPQVLRDCFSLAVTDTFDKIYGGGATTSVTAETDGSDGIVSIISFVGDVTCSMVFGLPEDSAVEMAEKFAGFSIPFDSPDMGDVVGELANVLAGVINGQLERAHLKTQMSLPTVARLGEIKMLLPGNLSYQKLHFFADDTPFWVKIVVAKPSRFNGRS